jgi:hypothetical protein
MELINSRTGECRGNILILDNPAESPSRRLLTIRVDQKNWEMLEAITNFRKELVKAFRRAYGYEAQSLLNALDSIDECVFTIASYGRIDWQSSEEQEQVSTRNLSAVADRLSNMIVEGLSSLIVRAEDERVNKVRRVSTVPLFFSVYANTVWHYALNSVSYALRTEDSRNTLLRIVGSLGPDAD